MYVPPYFEETRSEEILRVIDEHPLGALVVNGPAGLDAAHIPFEFDPQAGAQGVLRAHVARANPIWQESKDGDEVLVIFRGGDAYISPNWYPSKHETHRQVPTWNYQVVHVHGKIRFRDDLKFIRGVVGRLTRIHEARADVSKPWTMSDSDRDFIDQLLAAVVGVEVEVDRIVAKSKLNQNKNERDRANVEAELRRRGHVETAEALRNADIAE